jgi:hypothetical protein
METNSKYLNVLNIYNTSLECLKELTTQDVEFFFHMGVIESFKMYCFHSKKLDTCEKKDNESQNVNEKIDIDQLIKTLENVLNKF